jgi:ORF6N domain
MKMATKKQGNNQLIPSEIVVNKIYIIRDTKVMLDKDLAALYEVETKRFNEQIRRNVERFPEDFMFRLTKTEFENLRSQIATSSWGGARYLPLAFTEQGVAMLSGVINSSKAIAMNIAIMRAFITMRKLILNNKNIEEKFSQIDDKFSTQDAQFSQIYEAIENLLDDKVEKQSLPKNRRRIGFRPDG